MQSLAQIVEEKLAFEREQFDASNKTLVSLIRTHYDDFTKELFPLLQARGEGCYAAVQEILRSAGKEASIDAIKQAMKKVRQERVGAASIGSSRRRGHPPKGSGAGLVNRPARVVAPAKNSQDLPPARESAVSPQAMSEGRGLQGAAGGLSWSMEPTDRGKYDVVFDGLGVPYKNSGVAQLIMPTCTRLYSKGDREGLLEALNFLKSYMGTFTNMPVIGEGLAMKTMNWPQAEANLVVSIQNDIKKL